jgi:hypothetical protein
MQMEVVMPLAPQQSVSSTAEKKLKLQETHLIESSYHIGLKILTAVTKQRKCE